MAIIEVTAIRVTELKSLRLKELRSGTGKNLMFLSHVIITIWRVVMYLFQKRYFDI